MISVKKLFLFSVLFFLIGLFFLINPTEGIALTCSWEESTDEYVCDNVCVDSECTDWDEECDNEYVCEEVCVDWEVYYHAETAICVEWDEECSWVENCENVCVDYECTDWEEEDCHWETNVTTKTETCPSDDSFCSYTKACKRYHSYYTCDPDCTFNDYYTTDNSCERACNSDEHCDSGSCVPDCDDSCPEGDYTCMKSKLYRCEDTDSDPCTDEYVEKKDCTNDHCESQGRVCKNGDEVWNDKIVYDHKCSASSASCYYDIFENDTFCPDEKIKTCGTREVCEDGACMTPECFNDGDCDDGKFCTNDICNNPGTANANCTNPAKPDGTDCGSCKECQGGSCNYLCDNNDSSCYCSGDSCVNCNTDDGCYSNECEYCSGGDRWKGDTQRDYYCSGGISCLYNSYLHSCNQTEINNCQGNGCQASGCNSTCNPDASISCSKSNCGGGDCSETYQPTSNVNPCVYELKNNSTDPDGNSDIVESRWYIKEQGGSYSLITSCTGICDYVLQNRAPGNYTLKLEVEDNFGAVDSTTQSLEIKREIKTDFECSLDPNANWKDCNNINPTVDETIFLRDTSILSEDASSFTSYQWETEGEDFGTNSTSSLSIEATTLDITLITWDNDGRVDSKTYTINSSPPLPGWEETTP